MRATGASKSLDTSDSVHAILDRHIKTAERDWPNTKGVTLERSGRDTLRRRCYFPGQPCWSRQSRSIDTKRAAPQIEPDNSVRSLHWRCKRNCKAVTGNFAEGQCVETAAVRDQMQACLLGVLPNTLSLAAFAAT